MGIQTDTLKMKRKIVLRKYGESAKQQENEKGLKTCCI